MAGNPTQQTNVILVNTKGLTTTAGAANQADITTAFARLSSAMQSVGFGVTTDFNNDLTIAGNNVETKAATNNGAVANLTGNTATAVEVSGAAAALANVTAAVNSLGNISSDLGSASNHITGMTGFTTALSASLTAGVGALTDADMAAESAKLSSLQTKQQLAIQAMTIANQQPQALLKLFGA